MENLDSLFIDKPTKTDTTSLDSLFIDAPDDKKPAPTTTPTSEEKPSIEVPPTSVSKIQPPSESFWNKTYDAFKETVDNPLSPLHALSPFMRPSYSDDLATSKHLDSNPAGTSKGDISAEDFFGKGSQNPLEQRSDQFYGKTEGNDNIPSEGTHKTRMEAPSKVIPTPLDIFKNSIAVGKTFQNIGQPGSSDKDVLDLADKLGFSPVTDDKGNVSLKADHTPSLSSEGVNSLSDQVNNSFNVKINKLKDELKAITPDPTIFSSTESEYEDADSQTRAKIDFNKKEVEAKKAELAEVVKQQQDAAGLYNSIYFTMKQRGYQPEANIAAGVFDEKADVQQLSQQLQEDTKNRQEFASGDLEAYHLKNGAELANAGNLVYQDAAKKDLLYFKEADQATTQRYLYMSAKGDISSLQETVDRDNQILEKVDSTIKAQTLQLQRKGATSQQINDLLDQQGLTDYKYSLQSNIDARKQEITNDQLLVDTKTGDYGLYLAHQQNLDQQYKQTPIFTSIGSAGTNFLPKLRDSFNTFIAEGAHKLGADEDVVQHDIYIAAKDLGLAKLQPRFLDKDGILKNVTEKQVAAFDDKGALRGINWDAVGYQTTDMTLQMIPYLVTGMAIEKGVVSPAFSRLIGTLQAAEVPEAAGLSTLAGGAETAPSATNTLARLARLGTQYAIKPVVGASLEYGLPGMMYFTSPDAIEGEMRKGLSFDQAIQVNSLRTYFESVAMAVAPEQMNAARALFIRGELKNIAENAAYKTAVQTSWKHITGQTLGDGFYNFLFNTSPQVAKQYLKTVGSVSLQQDLALGANSLLDTYNQGKLNAGYAADYSVTSEKLLNNTITAMATMLPLSVLHGFTGAKAIQDAQYSSLYTVAASPEKFLSHINSRAESGDLSREEALRQTKIVQQADVINKGLRDDYDKIDSNSALDEIGKGKAKFELFKNKVEQTGIIDKLTEAEAKFDISLVTQKEGVRANKDGQVIIDRKQEKVISDLNDYLKTNTEKYEKIKDYLDFVEKMTPAQKQLFQYQQEFKRLESQYDTRTLNTMTTEDAKTRIADLQNRLSRETNPQTKELYENLIDKLDLKVGHEEFQSGTDASRIQERIERFGSELEKQKGEEVDPSKLSLEQRFLLKNYPNLLKGELDRRGLPNDWVKGAAESETKTDEQAAKDEHLVTEKERIDQITDPKDLDKEWDAAFKNPDLSEAQRKDLGDHIMGRINTLEQKSREIPFGGTTYTRGDFVRIKDYPDNLFRVEAITDDNRLKVSINGDTTQSAVYVTDPKDITTVSNDEKNTFFAGLQEKTKKTATPEPKPEIKLPEVRELEDARKAELAKFDSGELANTSIESSDTFIPEPGREKLQGGIWTLKLGDWTKDRGYTKLDLFRPDGSLYQQDYKNSRALIQDKYESQIREKETQNQEQATSEAKYPVSTKDIASMTPEELEAEHTELKNKERDSMMDPEITDQQFATLWGRMKAVEDALGVSRDTKPGKTPEAKEKEATKETEVKTSRVFIPYSTQPQQITGEGTANEDIVNAQVSTYNKIRTEQQETGKSYSEMGYFVTVMNNTLPVDEKHQNKSVLDDYNSGKLSKDKIESGKIAVLTNNKGEIKYFAKDGSPSTKEEGFPIYQNLRGSMKGGKLVLRNEPSKEDLASSGETASYARDVERLTQIRKAKEPVTLEIADITPGFAAVTPEFKTIELKPDLVFSQGRDGQLKIFDPSLGTEVAVSKSPLLKDSTIKDDILAILDMNKKEGLPGNFKNNFTNRRVFVERFVYTHGQTAPPHRIRLDKENKTGVMLDGTPLEDLQLNVDYDSLGKTIKFWHWDGSKFVEQELPYNKFIADNYKVYSPIANGVNSYLKFGEPVGSKVENTPTNEEIIKPDTTISETPAKGEFTVKKKRTIIKSSEKRPLGGEGKPLPMLRSLEVHSTPAENEAAKDWFDQYVAKTGAKYEDLRNIANSDAAAEYFNGAIRLYQDGEYTAFYHEAYHDFSQNHLTPDEKRATYKEAATSAEGAKRIYDKEKKEGRKLSEDEKFNLMEELNAENFHSYKQTGKVKYEMPPKSKNIFKRMWEFLKRLFGKGAPDISTIFQKLGNLDIAKFKRSKDNAFFGKLEKALPGLSFKDTITLFKALDSEVARQFRDNKISISKLFKDKRYLEDVYHNISLDLQASLDHYTDEYNGLVDRYGRLGDKEREKLIPDLSETGKLVDNLTYTLNNWGNVVGQHLAESDYLKVSKKVVPEDLIENLEMTESGGKDNIYEDKERQSSRDLASYQLMYLLASLPAYQFREGIPEPKPNDFLGIINDVVEFDKAWANLAKALSGERDYGRMWDKMRRLAKTNPEYKELMESLPEPNTPGENLSLLDLQLVNQFIGAFSQPYVDKKIINFYKDESGNLKVYAKPGVTSSVRQLKDDWRNAVQEVPNQYRTYDADTSQYSVDVNSIASDFNGVGKLSRRRKEDFLEALGLNLSPQTKDSPEFKAFVESANPFQRLYTAVQDFVRLKTDKTTKFEGYNLTPGDVDFTTKPVYSILDIIEKTHYGRDKAYTERTGSPPKLVNGQQDIIDEIADMELKYSDKFSSDIILNSNGDPTYAIRPWSQQTLVYNILNDPARSTYQDLISTPLGAYFDFEKNPDANNIYVNSLFDVATGKRRTDRRGEIVKIDLYSHDGWNIQIDRGDGSTEDVGSKTIQLERSEKLIQDISALLLFGTKEHLRYGDKATANGTTITFNRILHDSTKAQPFLPVDIMDFRETALPDEGKAIFREILASALKLTNDYFVRGVGKNFDNFHQNLQKKEYWGFFDEILSKDTKDKLLGEGLISGQMDLHAAIDKHADAINKDLEDYLEKDFREVKKELESNTVLKPKDYISNDLLVRQDYGDTEDEKLDTILRAFSVNSYIMNAEHVRLLFQDPRFYDNKKGSYKEIFKRLSKASSTGKIAINNAQNNEYLAKNGRLERLHYNEEHTTSPAPILPENGVDNAAIMADVAVKAEDFLATVREVFKDAPIEEQVAIEKAYGDMTSTDAAGACTFDWYRNWKLRTGDDEWNNEKQELYAKLARGEELKGDEPLKAFAFFGPLKLRLSGYSYSAEDGRFYPIDFKFAITPLLSSLVKGKAFEKIRENMLRQNVSLMTFKSASKHSSLTKEGKHNDLYTKDGEINTGNYVTNPIHIEHLFEVVASPSDYKTEVTYATQRRKELFINSFEGGVPIDYHEGNWHGLSEEQKSDGSPVYKLFQNYGKTIEKLVELDSQRLLKSIDAKVDDKDNFSLDDEKLSNLLEREFKKRNLPHNVLASIETVNRKLKFALDASLSRQTIEDIFMSIADNRIRRQKVPGESLIQGSSTGYEPLNFKRVDSWKSIDGNDLAFYKREGRTLPDGTKVTSAMKGRIAWQGDFKKLANLAEVQKLVKEEKIEPREAVNRLIKDENWLDKSGVRKLITISGDKIPIQGPNSMEFCEVYDFLPEEAGPIIILPTAWVAKTGGDFDWDKNNATYPRISNNLSLYKPLNEEQKIQLGKTRKHLLNKFNSAVNKLQEQDILESNLRGELETYAFNLFSDDDDIVVEAKQGLDRILKSISKNEKAVEDLQEQIVNIKNLSEEMDDRAYYQNELLRVSTELLQMAHLYEQMITPNSTYMFEPIADARQEVMGKAKGSYSQIPTVRESLNQFESNTVGRQSLGIGALANTYFSLLQNAGVTLEPTFIGNPEYGTVNYTSIRLPHNKIKGKTSVSGIYSRAYKGSKYRISEAISQLMNGWVDVAKKDWIFYINGIKEVAPKMLYALMTGIHKDPLIGLFTQPAISDYVKALANYKSDIVRMHYPELYKSAKVRAIYDVLKKWLPEDIDISYGKNKYGNAMELFTDSLEKPAFFYGHLRNGMRKLADENVDMFDPKFYMKFGIPYKDKKGKLTLSLPSSKEEHLAQALYLIQYLEFEQQQGIMDNIRRTINQDTTKPLNLQDSQNRLLRRDKLDDFGLVSREHIDKLAEGSTIRAFTNPTKGIDGFLKKLTANTFEITNHPLFNKFLYREFNRPQDDKTKWDPLSQQQLVTEKGNRIPFNKRFEVWEDWVRDIKNDFISYLYQNYIYKPQTANKVVDYVLGMMKYETALALDLESIKRNHPELVQNNPLIEYLMRDNSRKKRGDKKPAYVSLKLRKSKLDASTSNMLTEGFDNLLNSPSPEYQQFAKKLAHFAFIQSGLSKSDISFANIIPQDKYGEDMTQIIEAFRSLMDTNPEKAMEEIKAYYKLFRPNYRKYYTAQFDEDQMTGQPTPDIRFRTETKRFKDYINPHAYDLLSKKMHISVEEYRKEMDAIKAKTSRDTEAWTKTTAKENPNNFYIYETNEKNNEQSSSAVIRGSGSAKNTLPNTAPITLMKSSRSGSWTDDTYDTNLDRIDTDISVSLAQIRETNPDKILFPADFTEVSKLKESAPKTFDYLAEAIKDNFGLDINPNGPKVDIEERETPPTPDTTEPTKSLESLEELRDKVENTNAEEVLETMLDKGIAEDLDDVRTEVATNDYRKLLKDITKAQSLLHTNPDATKKLIDGILKRIKDDDIYHDFLATDVKSSAKEMKATLEFLADAYDTIKKSVRAVDKMVKANLISEEDGELSSKMLSLPDSKVKQRMKDCE